MGLISPIGLKGLIPSATTELIAAISSFCISGLVYVACRGMILMIARKHWSFSKGKLNKLKKSLFPASFSLSNASVFPLNAN